MRGEVDYGSDLNKLKALLNLAQVIILTLDRDGRVTFINRKGCEILGCSEEEILGKSWFDNFLPQEIRKDVERVFQKLINGELEPVKYNENPILTKDGRRRLIAWHNSFLRDESGNIVEIISAGEDITELKTYVNSMTNMYNLAKELILEDLDFLKRARIVVKSCVEHFGSYMSLIGWAEPDGRVRILANYPEGHPYFDGLIVRWDDSPYGMGSAGRAIRSGLPQVIEDIYKDVFFKVWGDRAEPFGIKTVASFPMISKEKVYGVLTLYSKELGFFTKEKVEVFQAIANFAASSLESARLFEESQKRLNRLQALRNIDRAISGSLDPKLTIKVVLEEVVNQLGVNAASVLHLDPWVMELGINCCGFGFTTRNWERIRIRVGEGLAGRAILEKRVLWLENADEDPVRGRLMREEGFKSYVVAPLISKGKVLGVLEIFKRSFIDVDEEWLSFLETLAGQLAIAIDNIELLRSLETTNFKLIQAYEATIESLAKVLELRDRETEGHSERVTELTVKVAKKLGICGEALLHIRRGALLHDIGKLAIPDSILFKPGKLSEEDWEIMKKHPVYAYELLSKIEYLRPALEIPYYHHERWDGSGYPKGLKGEEIPISARIFAVVDVYDALIHDRPYRKAWSREEAIDYIKRESGKLFDPKVVKAFLEVLREEGNGTKNSIY
ncbi:MAG: GAF domain-containing protein [Synergistetes bacterium]|nr:GAF domain-containing protein [Synergistota bacterium]MDW8192397.1 GAF domain-containing protein [Synergistota bacterium]